jgi:hypothetical protein
MGQICADMGQICADMGQICVDRPSRYTKKEKNSPHRILATLQAAEKDTAIQSQSQDKPNL